MRLLSALLLHFNHKDLPDQPLADFNLRFLLSLWRFAECDGQVVPHKRIVAKHQCMQTCRAVEDNLTALDVALASRAEFAIHDDEPFAALLCPISHMLTVGAENGCRTDSLIQRAGLAVQNHEPLGTLLCVIGNVLTVGAKDHLADTGVGRAVFAIGHGEPFAALLNGISHALAIGAEVMDVFPMVSQGALGVPVTTTRNLPFFRAP